MDKHPGPLILIVDDEEKIIRFVQINLELEGFRVISATSGLQALERVRSDFPDLVLLDVMMPDLDGFEVLRLIREISDVPVIMLTVRSDEEDVVRGLELGADDYITKPFSVRELTSRIRAVLRRAGPGPTPESAILKIDDYLSVDFNTREVIVGGERVKLRPTEFRLLRHLIENAGWVVPYETLLAKVWGPAYRDEVHYLRLYITYLRQKIEPDPANPRYIFNVRGVGYRFRDFRHPEREESPPENPSEQE